MSCKCRAAAATAVWQIALCPGAPAAAPHASNNNVTTNMTASPPMVVTRVSIGVACLHVIAMGDTVPENR